jgi:hypothetical protein
VLRLDCDDELATRFLDVGRADSVHSDQADLVRQFKVRRVALGTTIDAQRRGQTSDAHRRSRVSLYAILATCRFT